MQQFEKQFEEQFEQQKQGAETEWRVEEQFEKQFEKQGKVQFDKKLFEKQSKQQGQRSNGSERHRTANKSKRVPKMMEASSIEASIEATKHSSIQTVKHQRSERAAKPTASWKGVTLKRSKTNPQNAS